MSRSRNKSDIVSFAESGVNKSFKKESHRKFRAKQKELMIKGEEALPEKMEEVSNAFNSTGKIYIGDMDISQKKKEEYKRK